MKTENTPENKERFISLYWGQEVARVEIIKSRLDIKHVGKFPASPDSKCLRYLELTPLSQISDEDAIEVAKINGHTTPSITVGYRYLKYFGITHFRSGTEIMIGLTPNINTVDFLRSRGYYVGDGTEIEYGWVVLKTD